MTVNLYEVGIPMLSDQAYYVGVDEFKEGFFDAVETLTNLPLSTMFFSKLRTTTLGLLAASETGDIRFRTRSKSERIAADDWMTFTVSEEDYNKLVDNSPLLQAKITVEGVKSSVEIGKSWVKKSDRPNIELSDIATDDRRRILSAFYGSLTSEKYGNMTIVPAYFRPELCYQSFNLVVERYLTGGQEDYKILDPTSGWGDRMIGFALTAYITKKKIYYHANDMNEELREPYHALINKLNQIEGLSEYFIPTFTIGDALDLTIDQLGDGEWDFVDMIFTSPPYYDMEDTLRGEATYSEYEDWEQQWFSPFIDAMIDIDSGTVLVLHLAETTRAPLISSFRDISPWEVYEYIPRGLNWDLNYRKEAIITYSVETDISVEDETSASIEE